MNADDVKRVRHAAGWTQTELADTLGIARRTVQHWESGRHDPLPRDALRLAELDAVPHDPGPDSAALALAARNRTTARRVLAYARTAKARRALATSTRSAESLARSTIAEGLARKATDRHRP